MTNPTERTELRALAERVMALAGPCRETDEAIALSVGWRQVQYGPEQRDIWKNPCGALLSLVPAFTASLDAAMTLVPEVCQWQVSTQEPGPWAWVGNDSHDPPAQMAATPDLALAAAALFARAAIAAAQGAGGRDAG